MTDFKEAVEKYNEMTGENITMEDVFRLEQERKSREDQEVEIITATENDLEQVQFKVDRIMKDFCEYYAPKGRKLVATFHIIKDNNKDTYGEKVVFGDHIEVILNIDIGTKTEDE